MNKAKQIESIHNQIRELNELLHQLDTDDYDPVETQLQEDLAFQKNSLVEARQHLKEFQDEVRWWTKEVAKIEKYILKIQGMIDNKPAKKKKKPKPKPKPKPRK